MSDPIDGRIVLIESSDGGRTWRELPEERRPKVEPGEAGFAASGTNMCVDGEHGLYIALGGAVPGERHPSSRVVYSNDRGKTWSTTTVPIPRAQTSGIFSIEVQDGRHAVAVGGDYSKPDSTTGNVAVAPHSIREWSVPTRSGPRGYRSCVARIQRGKSGAKPIDRTRWLIAVGPNGTDISKDGGHSWQLVNELGFHSVQFAPDGAVGWATGADGRVAKILNSF
jgi:photosystem II stability/assembly factor-like uncharacterized protein